MSASSQSNPRKKANIIKASRLLQLKAGTGQIDAEKIKRSQEIIEQNSFDFKPIAASHLDDLATHLAMLEAMGIPAMKNTAQPESGTSVQPEDIDHAALLQSLIEPVMHIKANAAMFKHRLAGQMAHIMLGFLESLETIDRDIIDIVRIYYKTSAMLIDNDMTDERSAYGRELQAELKEVCRRYKAKHKAGTDSEPEREIVFIDG